MKKIVEKITLFLLLVRSSLDIFTNESYGFLKFNIPALWGLIMIIWGFFYFLIKSKIEINKIIKFFVFWIIILMISVVNSFRSFGEDGLISIREWTRILSIFITFLIFYNLIENIEQGKRLIKYSMLALVVPLGVAVYQIITSTGIIEFHLNIVRIHSTFTHPNSFALFLVFFILLNFWFYQSSRNKIFWLMLLFIEIICLIFTFSFSGYILLLVSIVPLILNKKKFREKIFILFNVFVFIFLASLTKEFRVRFELVERINLNKTIKEGEVVESFTWRVVNWMNLLDLWEERPILGWGLSTIQFINPWRTLEGIGYAAHNDFLKLIVETGLIGLIFYLLFVFNSALFIYREYNNCREIYLKNLLFILFSFFLAWQILSAVDNYLTVTAFQFYFWSIVGMSLKQNKLLKSIRGKNENNYYLSAG
jgi:O-antigen ligase